MPVSMRALPSPAQFKKGDVMVVFGELFSRGYANGLVDAAEKAGMTVVRATVGRRNDDGSLRPLTAEEAAGVPRPFINVPLEAGFDMEPAADGQTPCDQLTGVKMKEWDQAKLDWTAIEQSQKAGVERFRKNCRQFLKELEAHIPAGANVLFAHTMAGGVPRAKILMPTMNKVFKGKGDRFLSSELFWESDIGRLCEKNFNEVTADTFKYLVEESAALREKIRAGGGRACYVAYGYHGTEILMGNDYRWQSYAPYVQGWAKIRLENHAKEFHRQGIPCTVYNCPEILTNSSSIFLGVEVCLYPLMAAYRKEFKDSAELEKKLKTLSQLLKDEHSIDEVLKITAEYSADPVIQSSYDFETWPQHNKKEQMEIMLDTSARLIGMHKDGKDLMTFPLSEDVFRATGQLMFDDCWTGPEPVWWLNHDIVAKQVAEL